MKSTFAVLGNKHYSNLSTRYLCTRRPPISDIR